MTLIRRTNPFGEMLALRQAMHRLVTLPNDGKADEAKPRPIAIKAGRSTRTSKRTSGR